MNYWYFAHDNELFLDLDSKSQIRRAFRVLRAAMRRKDAPCSYPYRNGLNVRSVFLYPSKTRSHAHLIILLKENLTASERASWSLWMGGDPLRAVYALERSRHGLPRCELLVTEKPYGFREHDFGCFCKDKHKHLRVTKKCPALRWMLGDHASADYFPRVRDERKSLRDLVLPWGQVSKQTIQRWEAPRWLKNKATSI